jgi:hypothetical protein
MYSWPKDLPEISSRVRVDFSLTAAEVGRMSVDNFTAVEQLGPNYGAADSFIERLIQAARGEAKPAESGTKP